MVKWPRIWWKGSSSCSIACLTLQTFSLQFIYILPFCVYFYVYYVLIQDNNKICSSNIWSQFLEAMIHLCNHHMIHLCKHHMIYLCKHHIKLQSNKINAQIKFKFIIRLCVITTHIWQSMFFIAITVPIWLKHSIM